MRALLLGALVLSSAAVAAARPLDQGDEVLQGRAGGAERFKSARPRLRRDRLVDVLHIKLEIAPNLETQTFEAAVTHRFRVLARDFQRLELDAKELDIKRVTDEAGRALDFETLSEALLIRFPRVLPAGSEHAVRIEYSAAPRMGLHFFKADPRYPEQPRMAWSQGEAEQNRYWIPLYDTPNERSSSEVLVTVSEGLSAVSNGRLVSRSAGPKPGLTVFHWLQERPHAGYLIALYVNEHVRVDDQASVPMSYWVPPGREDDARRTFAKTPAMMTYFSELLETPYPWAKYDQVLIYQPFFGGMENTSATSLYERILLDPKAAIDMDRDGLIAHELAHQWFGDLITCKDWSHLWLNEGFATFMQAVWTRHDLGKDEGAYDLARKAQRYFSEHGAYARPTVTDRYDTPDDMFDRHTYERGAWILQMLRAEVGEERFWKSLRRYLRQRQDTAAETEDLRRAFEETTGRSLMDFFSQWLYGAGYPMLTVAADWEAAGKKLTLKVTQRQAKDGGPLFRFKLPVDAGGKRFTAEVSKAQESFTWDVAARPKFIGLDPEQTVLAGYKLELPDDMLLAALEADPDVAGRLRAAKALSEKPSPKAIAALHRCLAKDAFWGVAAACASELGGIGGPEALAALKAGIKHAHPKVRRAAASALGGFPLNKDAFDALAWPAAGDASWFVQAAALHSLGWLRLPEAQGILLESLKTDSWNNVIRQAALEGLGHLKDEKLLPLFMEWSAPGKSVYARQSAIGALAEAGEGKEAVRDQLSLILDSERDLSIAGSAMSALSSLGDPAGASAISRAGARQADPSFRRRAEDAAEALRDSKKGRLEELSKQIDKAVEKLETLEKRLGEAESKKK